MKFFFIFILCIASAIIVIAIKNNNTGKLKTNGSTTTGVVTDVFFRGKMPYCKFSYQVDGVDLVKKQFVQKHLVSKILNNTYTVIYQTNNPKNAIIKFKEKVN